MNRKPLIAMAALPLLLAVGSAALAADPSNDQTQNTQNTQTTSPSLGTQISNDTKSVAHKTGRVVSDSWITTKVKSALLADSLTKGAKITVTTTNHVVMLGGAADTEATAKKAITIAQGIEGVQSVDATGIKIGTN